MSTFTRKYMDSFLKSGFMQCPDTEADDFYSQNSVSDILQPTWRCCRLKSIIPTWGSLEAKVCVVNHFVEHKETALPREETLQLNELLLDKGLESLFNSTGNSKFWIRVKMNIQIYMKQQCDFFFVFPPHILPWLCLKRNTGGACLRLPIPSVRPATNELTDRLTDTNFSLAWLKLSKLSCNKRNSF
jgi:hypothetical protein